jgi:hypothetical protein
MPRGFRHEDGWQLHPEGKTGRWRAQDCGTGVHDLLVGRVREERVVGFCYRAFAIAGLNDLDACAADMSNACLCAPCREKIWTVAGPEFGSDSGCVFLVVRAPCGLKSSGASWRAVLAQSLTDIGCASTRVDPDVWIRAAFKPDGFECCETVLVHVDDILHMMSHDTEPTMEALRRLCELKPKSCGPPQQGVQGQM